MTWKAEWFKDASSKLDFKLYHYPADAVEMSCFTMQYKAGATNGQASSIFRDLRIINACVSINIVNGSYYIIDGACNIRPLGFVCKIEIGLMRATALFRIAR